MCVCVCVCVYVRACISRHTYSLEAAAAGGDAAAPATPATPATAAAEARTRAKGPDAKRSDGRVTTLAGALGEGAAGVAGVTGVDGGVGGPLGEGPDAKKSERKPAAGEQTQPPPSV